VSNLPKKPSVWKKFVTWASSPEGKAVSDWIVKPGVSATGVGMAYYVYKKQKKQDKNKTLEDIEKGVGNMLYNGDLDYLISLGDSYINNYEFVSPRYEHIRSVASKTLSPFYKPSPIEEHFTRFLPPTTPYGRELISMTKALKGGSKDVLGVQRLSKKYPLQITRRKGERLWGVPPSSPIKMEPPRKGIGKRAGSFLKRLFLAPALSEEFSRFDSGFDSGIDYYVALGDIYLRQYKLHQSFADPFTAPGKYYGAMVSKLKGKKRLPVSNTWEGAKAVSDAFIGSALPERKRKEKRTINV